MPSQPAPRALLLLVLLLAGCGSVKSPTEPLDTPGGSTVFTFSQIQVQIFNQRCAKAGCHAASAASAGLVLEPDVSYGLLVGHPSTENGSLNRVEPGNPDRSYIILKLRGDPSIVGARMPFDGPPYLSDEQIAGIANWIRAGAPNN